MADILVDREQAINEIDQHLASRYVSPVEAIWHILEFPMHEESPTVYRLPVHLEGHHLVYFEPGQNPAEILARQNVAKTPLTAWFDANLLHPEANQVLYPDFPRTWVYVKKTKVWKMRQRGDAIGRMYFASPNSGERFYLRMLLTVVAGATSFQHLRTFDGVVHDTFREACVARGLLEDDREWAQCLREAGEMQLGSALRRLFAVILQHCHPVAPQTLWENHKGNICDDVAHKLGLIRVYEGRVFTDDEVHDYGLHLLNKILMKSGKTLRYDMVFIS